MSDLNKLELLEAVRQAEEEALWRWFAYLSRYGGTEQEHELHRVPDAGLAGQAQHRRREAGNRPWDAGLDREAARYSWKPRTDGSWR